jgi:hypothetical protein
MMYFFALQDCWPTLSNYTSPSTKRLVSAIDPLTEMYRAYLAGKEASVDAGKSVLLIVPEPLGADVTATGFHNDLVASFEASIRGAPVRAFAYLQSRQ